MKKSSIFLRYPTSWEEISVRDLRAISRIISLPLTREEMLLSLFLQLTGVKRVSLDDDVIIHLSKRWRRFTIDILALQSACNDLSFILDSVGLPGECPLKLNRKLHGVSFGSYFYADSFIVKYETTFDKSFLKKALNALGVKYRLNKTNIATLLIYWRGLAAYYKERYPYVFSENESGSYSPADNLSELLAMISDNSPQYNKDILSQGVNDILVVINNKLDNYANSRKS